MVRRRNARCRSAAQVIATLAAVSFPTLALAAADNASLLPRNLSPWGMFVNADIVVQAVMVGLALASLATWTVWLSKTIGIAPRDRAGAGGLNRSRPAHRCPSWSAIARRPPTRWRN